MKSLNANEAKTKFGEMLLNVQRSPVQINKNGKPVAVMVSVEEFENMEALKLQMLKQRAQGARKEIESGLTTDGDTFFDELLADKNN